jgi:hypothetical protein
MVHVEALPALLAQQATAPLPGKMVGTKDPVPEQPPHPAVDTGAQWLDQIGSQGLPTIVDLVQKTQVGIHFTFKFFNLQI